MWHSRWVDPWCLQPTPEFLCMTKGGQALNRLWGVQCSSFPRQMGTDVLRLIGDLGWRRGQDPGLWLCSGASQGVARADRDTVSCKQG